MPYKNEAHRGLCSFMDDLFYDGPCAEDDDEIDDDDELEAEPDDDGFRDGGDDDEPPEVMAPESDGAE